MSAVIADYKYIVPVYVISVLADPHCPAMMRHMDREHSYVFLCICLSGQ